jgi:hypothetical protein
MRRSSAAISSLQSMVARPSFVSATFAIGLSGCHRSTPRHRGLTGTRRAVDIMSAEPNVKHSATSRVRASRACRDVCRMTTARRVSRLPRRARHGACVSRIRLAQCLGRRRLSDNPTPSRAILVMRDRSKGPTRTRRIEGARASTARASSRRSPKEIAWVEFIRAANPTLPILLVTVEAGRA